MDPKITKKTQDTLGKIIKKPPLTDKLLGKPPFRFLHDVMTSVIKSTGFMQGLFTESEMNSENVKDKDSKVAFLQKAIDIVCAVTGKDLNVKPVKIVAGHEPERTNEFLQALADAINKNVDNDEYVKRVLKGGRGVGSAKEDKREERKEKTKSASERKKDHDSEDGKREDGKREKSRDKGDRDGERKHDRDKDRDKHKEKERESKTREKSRDGREDRHRDRDRERDRSKKCPQGRKPSIEKRGDKGVTTAAVGSTHGQEDNLHQKHPISQKAAKLSQLSSGQPETPTQLKRVSPNKTFIKTMHEDYIPETAVGDTSAGKKTKCSDTEHLDSTEEALAEAAKSPFTSLVAGQAARSPSGDSENLKKKSDLDVAAMVQGQKLSFSQEGEEMATGDHGKLPLDREHSREKENESPSRDKVNGEKESRQEPPARLQRPSSAKGSRRRREGEENGEDDDANEEDEEFQKPAAPAREPAMGEGDLPPQVAAARQLARPSSARPAPPRPKQEAMESEPAMRLGTGQPTNLIVDDDNDDEDENFLVEESAPPPPEPDPTPLKPPDEDEAEHGALVKKMLESKKELEGPAKKTEIERPIMSDAQRRKQRELVQKEIEKLRASIQSLTRSANPLGKVMDYVQEDMDSMQQELDKWRAENAQHALDLKREMSVTDRAIDPLRQQLAELDQSLKDQLDRIAATKCNIMKNDQKIRKMLQGISGS